MTVSEQSHGVMTVSEGHAHDLAARVNEQERSTLRKNVDAFNNVTSISLRNRFFWGFLGCCAALALIFLLFGAVGLAARILVFGFLGGLSYHIVVEMAGRRVVLGKMAQLLSVFRAFDWLVCGVGICTCLAALALFDLLAVLVVMSALACGLALTLLFTLDRQVQAQQREPMERIEEVLLTLRGQGIGDAELRQLVCVYGGGDWEPVFETLFGYEPMRRARARWGLDELGRARRRHRAGRDWVVDWLQARIDYRRDLPLKREEKLERSAPDGDDATSLPPRSERSQPVDRRQKSVREPAEVGTVVRVDAPIRRDFERSVRAGGPYGAANLMLGSRTRFLAGTLLIAGCLAWIYQNDLVPEGAIKDARRQIMEEARVDLEQLARGLVRDPDADAKPTESLSLGPVPESITGWFGSYRAGLAGVILVLSSCFSGIRIAPFAIGAALLVIVQPFGWEVSLTAVVGLVLLTGGVCFHVLSTAVIRTTPFVKRSDRIRLLNGRGEVVHEAPARLPQLRDRAKEQTSSLRVLRAILSVATRSRVSDIHLEPDESGGVIRMRVDGGMVELANLGAVFPRILNLVKILCDLDITKHRIVQEGHFSAGLLGRETDYRASFAPSVHGQKLVMRVLDSTSVPQNLIGLQMPDWVASHTRDFCRCSSGMFLVCGPTGSGKTTTLNAVLRDVDPKHCNVMTIEDPVEYQIDGATQIELNEQAGHTFATMLRSVLRQDPDVILVGEIRDADTARTAMQAAMTGHLVLSTVHATNAVVAITRLLDLQVAPALIESSLNAVLAQRLVRLLCHRCKKPSLVPAGEPLARKQTLKAHRPVGCSACGHTGYRGRRALFEMLLVNDAVKQAIRQSPTIEGLRDVLIHSNFTSLADAGQAAIAEGLTSEEEVSRIVGKR